MAIELKEVLSSLGLPEADTIQEFNDAMNKKFIGREDVLKDTAIRTELESAVTGKITTILQKNVVKQFGLSAEEVKGKKWEEIVDVASTKFTTLNEDFTKLSASNNDQVVKEWQTKAQKLAEEKTQLNAMLEESKTALTQNNSEWTAKFKGAIVGTEISKVRESIAGIFKDSISTVERKGYDAEINDSYTFDYDEDLKTVLVLNKSGERIKNTAKVGSFLTAQEAFTLKAEELGLIKKNPNGGKPAGGVPVGGQQRTPQQAGQAGDKGDGPKLHPDLEKKMQRLGLSQ